MAVNEKVKSVIQTSEGVSWKGQTWNEVHLADRVASTASNWTEVEPADKCKVEESAGRYKPRRRCKGGAGSPSPWMLTQPTRVMGAGRCQGRVIEMEFAGSISNARYG